MSKLFAYGVAAGPPAFAPQSRGDCKLWLDGRAGLLVSGADVTAWNDQAPVGDANHNLAIISGTPPTVSSADADFNGENAVVFAGSQYLKSGTWAAGDSQPFTIYVVFRWSATAGNYVFDGFTDRVVLTYGTAGNGFAYAGGAYNVDSAANTTLVFALVFNGASSAAYSSADPTTPIATGDASTNAISSLVLGARFTLGNALTGKIGCFGVFDGAHDLSARVAMLGGLGARYL